MTATGQDFTTYAGDDAQPEFTVTDGAGTPLDLSTASEIRWDAARDPKATAVLSLSKTGGAITFATTGADGKMLVAITAAQSAGLSGYYVHRVRVTDAAGNISTVSLGRMQVGRLPSYTYSGDPANSARDAVRFYIQDTDASQWQLADAEIDYQLTQYPAPMLAAAKLCRTLGAKYARKVDKAVGDLRIQWSQASKQYLSLAVDLEAQAVISGIMPYAGGTSLADMRAVASNTDRPTPAFQRGQFDNPSGINNTSLGANVGDVWNDVGPG